MLLNRWLFLPLSLLLVLGFAVTGCSSDADDDDSAGDDDDATGDDDDAAGDGEHPSVCTRSLEAGRITEAEGHAYEAYVKRGQEIEAEIERLKASLLAAMAARQQWAGQLVALDDETADTKAHAAENRKRARASEECEHDFMRRTPSYMRDNGEFEYVCEKCGCRDGFG